MKPAATLRQRLLRAALWTLLGGTLVLAPLWVWSVREGLLQAHDQRLTTTLLSLLASLERKPDGTLVQRRPLLDPAFDRPASGWYWQVQALDAASPALRSRSLWDRDWPLAPVPPDPQPRFAPAQDFDGTPLRVARQRIRLSHGGEEWVLIVVGETRAVSAGLRRFALVMGVGVVALWLLQWLAIRWQVRYGLRPLTRVHTALRHIRDGNQQRLEGDWPLELQPLVERIHELLERNRQVVERARQRTGDLAHALKHPLSRIDAEAQAPSADSWQRVADASTQLRRLVDRHLTLAASAAQGQHAAVSAGPICDALAAALARIHPSRIVHYERQGEGCFRGAVEDLEDMLGNLLDNAWKWCGLQVWVRLAASAAGMVRISVSDDGPGLDEGALHLATQRGRRFDEHTPGTGLGLHIVQQLAIDYGGRLDLRSATGGGLEAILELPGSAEVV